MWCTRLGTIGSRAVLRRRSLSRLEQLLAWSSARSCLSTSPGQHPLYKKLRKYDGSHSGSWAEALCEVDVAAAKGEVGLDAYTFLLRHMGKSGGGKEAMGLVKHIRAQGYMPDATFWSNLILAVGVGAGRWTHALHLLQSMEEFNLQRCSKCCNAALMSLAKRGKWVEARELLEDMETNGPQPDDMTYRLTISACGKGYAWSEALDILHRAEALNKVHLISYNYALAACARSGRWNEAVQLLLRMHEQEWKPDMASYHSAINACAKGGAWQTAVNLVRAMSDTGLRPDLAAYNTAISACSADGGEDGWRTALRLVQEARSAGLRPDGHTYSAAIAALGRGGQWRRALVLLRQTSQGMWDVTLFNSAIAACARSSQWDTARKLLEVMRSLNVTPDRISHNTALGGNVDVHGALREAVNRGELVPWEGDLLVIRRMSIPLALAALRAALQDIVNYNSGVEVGSSGYFGGHLHDVSKDLAIVTGSPVYIVRGKEKVGQMNVRVLEILSDIGLEIDELGSNGRLLVLCDGLQRLTQESLDKSDWQISLLEVLP
jgi:pentatricopeptide repeat protein